MINEHKLGKEHNKEKWGKKRANKNPFSCRFHFLIDIINKLVIWEQIWMRIFQINHNSVKWIFINTGKS